MKSGINKKQAFKLTGEHLKILDRERKMHLSGLTKSYTRTEANQIIKGVRTMDK